MVWNRTGYLNKNGFSVKLPTKVDMPKILPTNQPTNQPTNLSAQAGWDTRSFVTGVFLLLD